ncbi:MAG TPA: hypothetical protein O0X27_04815 [Methanocorpusculum sp.]|nr:hypothetical protein [Methanocorpusculum sp.]
MISAARISTPVYLDPEHGPHCGSCRNCAIENPYNPSNFGICQPHDTTVNIRRPTTCKQYTPRQ